MRPSREPDVFHAVAHPVRRAILASLRSGEHNASELASPFAMTAGAVSQHLRILEEARLVTVRQDGRHRWYSLESRSLAEVADWVNGFAAHFDERLDALGAYLDEKHRHDE